jgi:hypothetical protein
MPLTAPAALGRHAHEAVASPAPQSPSGRRGHGEAAKGLSPNPSGFTERRAASLSDRRGLRSPTRGVGHSGQACDTFGYRGSNPEPSPSFDHRLAGDRRSGQAARASLRSFGIPGKPRRPRPLPSAFGQSGRPREPGRSPKAFGSAGNGEAPASNAKGLRVGGGKRDILSNPERSSDLEGAGGSGTLDTCSSKPPSKTRRTDGTGNASSSEPAASGPSGQRAEVDG